MKVREVHIYMTFFRQNQNRYLFIVSNLYKEQHKLCIDLCYQVFLMCMKLGLGLHFYSFYLYLF